MVQRGAVQRPVDVAERVRRRRHRLLPVDLPVQVVAFLDLVAELIAAAVWSTPIAAQPTRRSLRELLRAEASSGRTSRRDRPDSQFPSSFPSPFPPASHDAASSDPAGPTHGGVMNAIDRQILESCRDGFRPLKPLIGPIASGTLYRHARRLGALGWLRKEGALYRTTDAGLRELASVSLRRPPDPLVTLYPPLAHVPTAAHRALIDLVLAAAVARHHAVRPDRHPFFVLSGATLRWKSSAGRFLCHALGLDPATHVVDCGLETGRSLSFRRGGTGAIVSRRALLDAPLLVLDEFLTADAAVRDTLGIFLSGRLVMPVENETLTVRPVPVLTLNPLSKDTLERRLGLRHP